MKKTKKIFKVFGIALLVLVGGVGVYGTMIWRGAAGLLEEAHYEITIENLRENNEEVRLSRSEPFSILLLGIDRDHPNDRGRSDTMMLVTINPNTHSTKMLSIARDTKVTIPDRGVTTRINHAFAYGGPDLAIETVQQYLNVPIDHFAAIDMEGFVNLIDAVGGVTVENDFAFSLEGFTFPQGELHLNGQEALNYSRMRKQDPRGDFGRQNRQRDVLDALVRRLATFAIGNFQSVFDAMEGNLTTSLEMSDIISISLNYGDALDEVIQKEMTGHNIRFNGMALVDVPEEMRQQMEIDLRNHLELD